LLQLKLYSGKKRKQKKRLNNNSWAKCTITVTAYYQHFNID